MIRAILSTFFVVHLSVAFGFASNIPMYSVGSENVDQSDFTVGLLIDSKRILGVDDVALQDSFELVNSKFIIKQIKNNYWFVFKINNSSTEKVKRVIGFDEVYMETADIYYQSDSGWHHEKNGLSQAINKRELRNRCPLFYVVLEPNETKTIYLKLHSGFALILGITIEDVPTFSRKEQGKIIGYWSYFGAAIAILLYNLFLLFHIRDKVYLYYIIYAICIIVFTFLYSGYSLYLNSNVKLHYVLHSSIALMGVFISLFTRELLNTKTISLWIDKTLLFISGVYILIAVLITVNIYFYQWLVLFGMPSMLFLLVVGIYSLTRNVPIAKYYVVALSGYLIGLSMIAAVNLGLIPFNTMTRYGFMIGSFIELSVFSLALGYRVKLLQDEKDSYLYKLLSSERVMKEKLEVLVAERTDELSTTVEELHTTVEELNSTNEELNSTNEKLHRLSLFKEDMTNMVIHDLKSPLGTIINVKHLNHEYGLNLVQQAGYNMLNLVQNILGVYKYESTDIVLNRTKVSIVSIIETAIEQVQLLAEEKEINIDFDKSSNFVANVDEDLLSRVFVNLMSNAIKFSPQERIVRIQFKRILEKTTKFSIINEGPPISRENQTLIFEKFGQDEKRKHGKTGSTGLGLTFCKMAVEAHGGKIGVSSMPNMPVEFWFTLPEVNYLDVREDPTLVDVVLTDFDKTYLNLFVSELQNIEIEEVSTINSILNKIEQRTQGIVTWKLQLEQAVYSNNCEVFTELLSLV